MTVVDTTTGEVIEIADAERAKELAAHVTSAIAHMNVQTGVAIDAMVDAYKERIWIGLGFGSWDELVDARNWRWKPLTSEDRAAFGEVFRNNGMSFRTIGRLMGTSDATVRRDLAGATFDAPAEVQGADGKTYAATQPERAVAGEELDDDHDGHTIAVGELPEDLPPTAVESADPPSVKHSEAVGPEPRSDSGPTLDQEPPATRLRDLGDPSDIWQADFAAEIVRVDRLFRRFPADEVAEMADADMYGSAEDLAKQVGRWFAEIELKRKADETRSGSSPDVPVSEFDEPHKFYAAPSPA